MLLFCLFREARKNKNPSPWSILLFSLRIRPITDKNSVLGVCVFNVGFTASKNKSPTLGDFPEEPLYSLGVQLILFIFDLDLTLPKSVLP